MPRIAAFREGWAWTPRRSTKVTKDTGIGNPAASTPEKGKRYFDDIVAQLSNFLVELDAADIDNFYA